jgi:hypothetical protein
MKAGMNGCSSGGICSSGQTDPSLPPWHATRHEKRHVPLARASPSLPICVDTCNRCNVLLYCAIMRSPPRPCRLHM